MSDIYRLLVNGISYMAMTNYPYASNFLNPMPAFPVNESCKSFNGHKSTSSPQELLTALNSATGVYFNYTGQTPCTDFSNTDGTGNLDGFGWNILSCNQIPMPISDGNSSSMFVPNTFNYN